MPASHWKGRFSDSQLEKKRLTDKISQRRSRQQAKRLATQLESRLQLLQDDEIARLINQMQQENALLRTKLWRYRFHMESIFLQGRDCMVQDEMAWKDVHATILTRPQPNQMSELSNGVSHGALHADSPGVWRDHSSEHSRAKMINKKAPSLFRELGSLLGCTSSDENPLGTNEILESIMMWKAKFAAECNDEFAVLLASQGLDAAPYNLTLTKVKEQASCKYLFHDIIQNILYGEEIASRQALPKDKIPEQQMSKAEYQKRAIAYCVYASIRTWRDCFKSSLEYLAVFWAHYRYYMVIAFPTSENFDKCPAWRRPVLEQFQHEHPLLVDLIVWPKVREELVSTWQQYELLDLCITISCSLEYRGLQVDAAAVIKLQSDSSDLILDEAFERNLHDIRNFTVTITASHFSSRYPKLASKVLNVDLQLTKSLHVAQQGASDAEDLQQHGQQEPILGVSDYSLAFDNLAPLAHQPRWESDINLPYMPDMEVPDLVVDRSFVALNSVQSWAETLAGEQLPELTAECDQSWDSFGLFPDLENYQSLFLDGSFSNSSGFPCQQQQKRTFPV